MNSDFIYKLRTLSSDEIKMDENLLIEAKLVKFSQFHSSFDA